MTDSPEYQPNPASPAVHPKITLGEIQVCIYFQPLQICQGLAQLLTPWHNARTIPLLAGFYAAKMGNTSRQRAAYNRQLSICDLQEKHMALRDQRSEVGGQQKGDGFNWAQQEDPPASPEGEADGGCALRLFSLCPMPNALCQQDFDYLPCLSRSSSP